MDAASIISHNIEKIVDIARFSPSVHNTQPWKVTHEASSISIHLDRVHTLLEGDPTGRQTYISLGIFTEAVVMAAQSFDLSLKELALQDETVILHFGAFPVKTKHDYVSLMKTRISDRSIYENFTISQEQVTRIEDSDQQRGIGISVITDRQAINTIANLTAQGIGMALTNPKFRKELAGLLVLPGSHKKRGISVKSLAVPWLKAVLEPFSLRFGKGLDKESELELKRWQSASAVICLTATADMPRSWLDAGRTYLQVALLVEELGLRQATSAAAVEASTFHEDVEKMIGTRRRLMSVIRIGHSKHKRTPSPRLQPSDLIIT